MCRVSLLLTVLALIGGAVSAAPLPPEIAGCRVYKVWRFDKSADGWRPDHNVGPFSLADGVLSFTLAGIDPWIINDSIGGADASKYHFFGVKMRTSMAGQNQIYFGTDKSPGGADMEADYGVRVSDKSIFYAVDMSSAKTWKDKITSLRIDPANGPLEVGTKVDIDWIALYQVPAIITLGRPYAGIDAKGAFVSVPVRNVGGETSEPGIIVSAGAAKQSLGPVKPNETQNVMLHIGQAVGEIAVAAKLDGKTLFDAVLQSPLKKNAPTNTLPGRSATLEIPATKTVNQAHLAAMGKAKPIRMGTFRPLATLAYRDANRIVHYIEASADSAKVTNGVAVLQGSRNLGGTRAAFKWTFTMGKDADQGSVTCELTTSAPLEVLRFEGPRFLAGEGTFGAHKSHAIFPGLEYLEKDEPSSSAVHVGPKLADRRVPHPFKVTVPIMAVEAEDAVAGISWEPLANWSKRGDALPCAEFESPNTSQGASNHLMTLFVPSIPEYVDQNTDFAAKPYDLKPGDSLKITESFFARSGSGITDAVADYYAKHEAPKPPALAHGVDGVIDTSIVAYARSLYSPEKNAWKSHIGIQQTPWSNNDYASLLIGESLRKGDPEIARVCKLDPDVGLAKYLGASMDWFSDAARSAAATSLAKFSPDGSVPYELTPDVAKRIVEFNALSGSTATALGDPGKTNCGLIGRELSGVLTYALRTGSREYVEMGLKGIDRLNSFTVPCGAQTWEVNAYVPDNFSAALAIDCNLAGFKLTGKADYLAKARYWAYSGLPFIYSWVPPINPVPKAVYCRDGNGEGNNAIYGDPKDFYNDPARAINPGATVSAFGTSFYIVNWFAVPVQWCGMVWANSVRHYLRVTPDPLLGRLTDAVFASCAQWQCDKGFAAGLYPDAWSVIDNQVNGPFIAPDPIIDYAYEAKGEKRPSTVESAGFHIGEQRSVLNTYARIESLEQNASGIRASLKFYAGQDVYSCIVPAEKPRSVSVDGAALAEVEDLGAAPVGFHYDAVNRAVHVKYRSGGRVAKVEAAW